MSKYTRQITQTLTDEDQGFTIDVDVYDILRAFNVTDPAIQHAVKKLLCTGIRGHKDSRQDLEEAVQSIERALDVVKVDEKLAAFANELQPVTSDNPQESPACPWRFGDVIRTRGEGTDFDWTITEITPRGVECRTGGRGEISTFIPFASYKDYDLVKEVKADEPPACPFKVGDILQHKEHGLRCRVEQINSDKRLIWVRDIKSGQRFYIAKTGWRYYEVLSNNTASPQPECPFKIGDIIQHNMDIEDQAGPKWQIVGIASERLSVVNFNDYNDASQIERRFWPNYSRVGTAAAEAKEQPGCPFKVGDIIAKPNSTGWKIDRILSDRLHVTSDDPYRTPSQIDRQFWPNYRIVIPTTLDATQQTC